MNRPSLFDQTPGQLSTWLLTQVTEKPYRLNQLIAACWQQYPQSFAELTNLPQSLREQFEQHYFLPAPLPIRARSQAFDGTQKVLFQLTDGSRIESVGLPKQASQLTFCLSTQVGCAMGCHFCATAAMGLGRQLSSSEIIGQVNGLQALFQRRPSNLVFMGMGEPLQNLDALRTSLAWLTHSKGLGLSPKRITVSTCGWLPGLKRWLEAPLPARLAISLNAVTNQKRDQLMPVNRHNPIEQLLDWMRAYSQRSRERITIEYLLLGGFNDQVEDAKILSRLFKNINVKVNIIPYNPIPKQQAGQKERVSKRSRAQGQLSAEDFQVPTEQAINYFLGVLKDARITATCRRSQGQAIKAACGQLAGSTKRRPS